MEEKEQNLEKDGGEGGEGAEEQEIVKENAD